jgi:hypothetical protein
MPILNAALDATRPLDDVFVPNPTVKGHDRPDYGLEFYVTDKDYKGDTFAFDSCTDPCLLMSTMTIDENFLICRYEPLFQYKPDVAPPLYYLVPWVGVPGVRTPTTDQWSQLPAKITLMVNLVRATAELLNSLPGDKVRKLRLVPSNTNMTATWVSSASADKKDQQFGNITTFPPQAVEISFTSPGTYQEIAEDIRIHEVKSDDTLGKKVGKLRLIFLDVITLKAILIKVTETDPLTVTAANPANFIYERILQTADIPLALESDDGGNTHANVLQGANTYGLKQIGINLELEKNTVEPYVHVGTTDVPMFRDSNNLPTPFKIAKGAGTAWEQYDAARTAFFQNVKYLQDGTLPTKLSKYSRIYIFFTSLNIPGKPGQSHAPTTRVNDVSKQSLAHGTEVMPNVSFFRWTSGLVPLAESEAKTRTLTHEGAHALLVEHYFDDKKELTVPASATELEKKYKYLTTFVDANVIFSLCLRPKPVQRDAMITDYETNKIKPEHFRNAVTGRLLFEDIIISGFDIAVDSFIDQVIFPASSSPPKPIWWKVPDRKNAGRTFILSDLYVWMALNDLVKFILYRTDNIMDYRDPIAAPTTVKVNTSNNKSYIDKQTVHFNRFQWQLARRTATRLNELIYQP